MFAVSGLCNVSEQWREEGGGGARIGRQVVEIRPRPLARAVRCCYAQARRQNWESWCAPIGFRSKAREPTDS